VKTQNVPISMTVQSFILARTADGRAPRTIEDYHRVLNPFATWCSDEGLDMATLNRNAVRCYVVVVLRGKKWAKNTVAIHIRNLRTFLHWCHKENLTDSDLSQAIESPKQIVRVEDPLTPDEIRLLLSSCQGSLFALRDRAMILVLWDTGLRVGEMALLQRQDVRLGKTSSWMIIYAPKTGTHRFSIMGEKTTVALAEYLASRRDTDSALWMGRQGRLTTRGIYEVVRRRAQSVGLKRVHPHLFRKTFATHWLDNGGDPERLRVLAGWSPATLALMLAIYVGSARQKLEKAHTQAGPVDRLL